MIKRTVFLLFAFLALSYAFSQTKTIRGYTLDLKTREPLEGVVIFCASSNVTATSGKSGRYKITVPKTATELSFDFPGYQTFSLDLQRHPKYSGQEVNLRCDSCDGLALPLKKNVIAIAPVEFFNLTTTLQYEHFVKPDISVGILLSPFYNSKQLIYQEPVYTGLKFAPFYRYYPWRNLRNGAFLQLKLIGGYFELDDISYHRIDYVISISDEFWTFGFGLAWGWAWYPYKKMVMNLSLGFQLFPMKSPSTITKDGQEYHRGNTNLLLAIDPWYFGGPGSLIEIKFTMGGIF